MKSSAPWSVKGVERDARETAKEAARREGMTVGEWLNQVIYTASDPVSSNGQIEGLKISDLVNAIEHVSKRVIGAESRGAEYFDDFSRNLGGVVDRLQRLERIKPVEAAGAASDIAERLARLEDRSSDRHRIEALRSLEKAIGQVALQFDAAQTASTARLQSLERQFQEVAGRFDAFASSGGAAAGAIDHLKNTVDGAAVRLSRLERAGAEAAKQKTEAPPAGDTEFVERTGARMRVLGDEIKRSGDQIRGLEGVIKKLSDQIDAAERRSSEGVQKVAETIYELRSQISESDAQKTPDPRAEIEAAMAETAHRTESRINDLQRSFELILTRLEQDDLALDEAVASGAFAPVPAAALPIATPVETPVAAPDRAMPDIETALSAFDSDFAPSRTAGEIDADFDFSDEPPAPAAQASRVLAEVEAAFSGADPSETVSPAEADEIDSILAELDGFADEAVEKVEREPLFEPAATSVAAQKPAASNYLQEARRAAKEAAEKAAAEASDATRRKLTPKQRAILAAKIKRKRLAAEQAAQTPTPAAAAPAPAPEAAPMVASATTARPPALSLIGKALGAIRSALPISGKADASAETRSAEPAPGSVRAAAVSGKSRIKPVTLALGAAIVLAGAALVFLVKDMVFGGKPKAPETRIPQAAADAPAAVAIKDPDALEIPTPPVVKPRALYLASVAKLKTAANDAETQVAMKGLEEAAALGHPPAQLQLGELYKLGQGAPQDAAQARAWYERAANGGNVLAMHRMGVMSARGQGGPADQAAAIVWFEKAAGLGLVDSQYNLGAIYHPGGEGAASGAQDPAKAYFWYALAAKNGDDQAGSLAAGLSAGLSADKRRSADAAIAAWTPQTPDPDANEVAPAS